MVSGQNTTRKWVGKFCELMDWFLGLEKVNGDNLGEVHLKGLAANYLAVKLSLFDESKNQDSANWLDRELPYASHLWQVDYLEDSRLQERRQWRLEQMTHWKHKAEQHGVFKATPFVPDVTEGKVHRYCDCIEGIIYRANGDWMMHGEVRALARQANDLAATLGLTHPDWILATDLGILPYCVNAEEIRQLPLPWDYDTPPVVLRNSLELLDASDVARLRESAKKAEALLHKDARGSHTDATLDTGDGPRFASNKRFAIALSFAGECRDFVEQVASCLAEQAGQERVLYDKYHEAEFAQPDLDVYLPNLYRTESELIVIFLCADYAEKRWCKLEWRSVRQLIATSENSRIMFISFDDIGAIPEIGILSGDGYVSVGSRSSDEIAWLILQRLQCNRQRGSHA